MDRKDLYMQILDCRFEALNDDLTYYKISDKELNKLILNVSEIKHERDVADSRYKRYATVCHRKIKRLEHEKHVYKVELGRCVRKLTRIYQNVYKAGLLGYVMGISDIRAKESVDVFKRM